MSVEIDHLRRFLAVAEELHFTRAAERLHIAQPALSANIRKLEETLQLRLFARSTRQVELTAEGSVFADAAREAVESYDRALATADRLRGATGGAITLGVYSAAGSGLKRAIVTRLREIDPDVDLTVVSESTVQIIQGVDEGTIHLGLCLAPVGTGRLRRVLIGHETLVAVLPPSHELAERDSIRLIDLREEEWILPGNRASRERSVLVRLCSEAGFDVKLSDAVSDFDDDFSGVVAGRGITVVPSRFIRRPLDDRVRFIPVDGVDAPLYLLSRPEERAPGIESVVRAVSEVGDDGARPTHIG